MYSEMLANVFDRIFPPPNSYVYNLFGPALNGFIRRELNKKVRPGTPS